MVSDDFPLLNQPKSIISALCRPQPPIVDQASINREEIFSSKARPDTLQNIQLPPRYPVSNRPNSTFVGRSSFRSAGQEEPTRKSVVVNKRLPVKEISRERKTRKLPSASDHVTSMRNSTGCMGRLSLTPPRDLTLGRGKYAGGSVSSHVRWSKVRVFQHESSRYRTEQEQGYHRPSEVISNTFPICAPVPRKLSFAKEDSSASANGRKQHELAHHLAETPHTSGPEQQIGQPDMKYGQDIASISSDRRYRWNNSSEACFEIAERLVEAAEDGRQFISQAQYNNL